MGIRDRKAKAKGGKDWRSSKFVDAGVRQEKHVSGFDKLAFRVPPGVSMLKAEKDKTYKWAVIPFVAGRGNPVAAEGDLYYERTYYIHGGIGPNKDTVVCSARTFKKPCAVCDFRAKLSQEPNPDAEMKATIKSLYPRERQLWNIVDVDDPKKGVQLFEVSNFCFGKALDAKINRARPEDKDKIKKFAMPDRGYYLMVGVSEDTTGQFKFLKYSDIEFKFRKEPYPDEWMDAAVCLDDLVKEPGYKEIKSLIESGGADDEDEDEDVDTDTKTGEDEDDEEGEDGDGEEDEGEGEEGDDEDEDGGDEEDSEDEDGDGDSDDEDGDGDSDDEDDDSEDDGEEDADDETPEVGDRVTFLKDGKRKKGKVIAVKGEVAKVRIAGTDAVVKVDVDALTQYEEVQDKPKPKKPTPKPERKPKKPVSPDDAPW